MPKIIVTSRYIKPNSHKKFGNYIKYIVTRERAILRMVLVMRAMNPRASGLMTRKPGILIKVRANLKLGNIHGNVS